MEDKYTILYVDDEQDNLMAFKAVFRRDYHIHLAQSGAEALRLMDENPIDLIISDQRMPRMTGVQLLEKVRKKHPEVIRMVLTGYSEVKTIIEAINKGKVYHYITKPWDVNELRQVMDSALEILTLKKKNSALEGERNSLRLKTAQMEKENVLAQFEILKNQINPHFLFNSMNILSSLIPNNPEKAIEFTNRFARLYRKVLQLREQLIVSLDQELEFVQSYLYLQKMRFDDSLQLNVNIESHHKESCLPPFSLQILVENAIKHNIISESMPLTIHIFTEKNFIKVVNNLQPRGDHPESTHIGLNNLKARYEMITSEPTSFTTAEDQYIAVIPLIEEG